MRVLLERPGQRDLAIVSFRCIGDGRNGKLRTILVMQFLVVEADSSIEQTADAGDRTDSP
jgi:hypothetical protein